LLNCSAPKRSSSIDACDSGRVLSIVPVLAPALGAHHDLRQRELHACERDDRRVLVGARCGIAPEVRST
jgi:hypothetical protein